MKYLKLLLKFLIAGIAVFAWGFVWSFVVRMSGLNISGLTSVGALLGGLLIGKFIIYDFGRK